MVCCSFILPEPEPRGTSTNLEFLEPAVVPWIIRGSYMGSPYISLKGCESRRYEAIHLASFAMLVSFNLEQMTNVMSLLWGTVPMLFSWRLRQDAQLCCWTCTPFARFVLISFAVKQ